MTDPHTAITERFARETAGHQLTVLHDDGLYRHLKFANPQYGGLYRYDLITWPNGLTIRGDGPNFVFAIHPLADLFDMFRASSHHGINPGYWQEKVVAGPVKAWSEELFRAWLAAQAASAEPEHPGIVDAVNAEILHGDEFSIEQEDDARYALTYFTHGAHQINYPAKWQEDFDDWSWEYLWACHAIVSGIGRYDAQRAAAPAEAVAR